MLTDVVSSQWLIRTGAPFLSYRWPKVFFMFNLQSIQRCYFGEMLEFFNLKSLPSDSPFHFGSPESHDDFCHWENKLTPSQVNCFDPANGEMVMNSLAFIFHQTVNVSGMKHETANNWVPTSHVVDKIFLKQWTFYNTTTWLIDT